MVVDDRVVKGERRCEEAARDLDAITRAGDGIDIDLITVTGGGVNASLADGAGEPAKLQTVYRERRVRRDRCSMAGDRQQASCCG